MNNNNKKIQESRKIILSIISIFTLLLIVPLVKAPADWTRVYCLYNAGSGGTACDSGQVGGDSASCSITNKCEEEGDIYCYAQSYNPIKGTTTAGPKNVDNVNWDTDQNDCECYVGNSACNNGICWGPIRGFGFESGTSPNCCGDNTDEYYKWQKDYGSSDPIVDSPIQTNEDNDACCNSVDSCVWDTTCFPKDSVIDYDGDGKTDSYCENNNNWADCDLEASVCETYCGYEWGVGLGDANADGGFSLTNCCGDDAGEYYIDGTATLSGAACCDSETDCVDADNICQPDRAVTTYNDHQYTCTDGEWNDDGRINGISCSNNSVCASGFCTDGYCCDSACDSLCQVCDLEGSLGSCTNIPVGTDPYDECTAENCFTGYCSGNASCDAYADDQQHNCANVCQYCHNGNPDGSCDSRPEGTQTGDCIDNHECNGFGECTCSEEYLSLCDDCLSSTLLYSWDKSENGYCLLGNCLVIPMSPYCDNTIENAILDIDYPTQNTLMCINDGEHIGDNYCDKGEWVSRTALLITQLLDFADSVSDDYSLFCDDYKTVFNYYSYILPNNKEVEDYFNKYRFRCELGGNYVPCTNNICVLRYKDRIAGTYKTIMGTSLNHNINSVSYSILEVFGNLNTACDSAIGDNIFKSCSDQKTWYNDALKSIIYSNETGLTFNGDIDYLLSKYLDYKEKWNDMLSDASSAFSSTPNPVGGFSFITNAGKLNKIYIDKKGNKEIRGIMEEVGIKGSGNTFMSFMYKNYNNICNFVDNRDNWNKWYLSKFIVCGTQDIANYVLTASDVFGAYNVWLDLGPKLRAIE